MDTAQWPQEIVVKPIEEIVTNSTPKPGNIERNKLARPQKDQQALNCPRCNSTNTKFCYYNNYSLTQPRYFCKTCRRYWTEGGSLRNIPVGGGSRKNKRSSSSSSPSIPSSKITRLPDLVHPHHHNPPKIFINNNNNNLMNQGQDLNLGYSDNGTDNMSHDLVHLPNMNNISPNNNSSTSSCTTSTSTPTTTTTTTTKPTTTNSHFSALELLTGLTNSRGFNSFMPMPIPDPNSTSNGNSTSGLFSLPEFKPSLGFSLDGLGTSTYAGLHNVQESSTGRLLFPFEDLKQVSTTTSTTTSTGIGINIEQNNIISKDHQQAHHDSAGYWTGMLGGGSW